MLTLIIVFQVLLLGIALCIYANKKYEEGLMAIGVFLIFVLSVSIIVGIPCTIIDHAEKAQNLSAFYDHNIALYTETINRTEALLSEEKYIERAFLPIEGSIEKTQLAEIVSKRLTEWRDATTQYNKDLYSYRYFSENIWTNIFYPTLPERLKPISIE